MAYTAPTAVTAGDALTASLYNTYVKDNIIDHELYVSPLRSAWTSYTPTFTQNVSVTPTVNYAKYMQVGKTVIGAVKMTATTSGTNGQQVKITVPVNPASAVAPIGTGYFYNGTVFGILGTLISGTTLGFDAYTQPGGGFGVAVAFQVVSGNTIHFTFQYEAA